MGLKRSGVKSMKDLRWDWGEPPDPKHWQLLSTLADREPFAIEHGLMAAKCVALTAQALTLPDEQISSLSIAGLLHDVGKITLPPFLLRKPSRLSDEEFELVKRHPSAGAQIAQAIRLPEEAVKAIWHHHERMDGKGYPFGKRGDEIPLSGRVVAVGELFSSFLTPRHYRSALSPARAVARLWEKNGEHLDAEVVKAFLDLAPQFFGAASLSVLERWTKPFEPEIWLEEERAVWKATNTFVSQLFWEAERLFGQPFCQNFTKQLNEWFACQKLPLFFQGLRLVSLRRWWQSLGEGINACRLLLGVLSSYLGHILGKELLTDWLETVRRSLPEQLDAVGMRYGLWLWRGNLTETEMAVKSR